MYITKQAMRTNVCQSSRKKSGLSSTSIIGDKLHFPCPVHTSTGVKLKLPAKLFHLIDTNVPVESQCSATLERKLNLIQLTMMIVSMMLSVLQMKRIKL